MQAMSFDGPSRDVVATEVTGEWMGSVRDTQTFMRLEQIAHFTLDSSWVTPDLFVFAHHPRTRSLFTASDVYMRVEVADPSDRN